MKKINLLLTTLFIILLTACAGPKNKPAPSAAQSLPHEKFAYQINSTPTLFFHGALSNYHSEENMVREAVSSGITDSVIRANVNADGKVKLIGQFSQNAKNPIVMVNYGNNIQLDYPKLGHYASNVVLALKQKYGFKQVNFVGHSLGNISMMYYLLAQNKNKNLLPVSKMVTIAGPFDGVKYSNLPESLHQPSGLIVIDGKPNKMNSSYRQLTKINPASVKNLSTLNVVGNTGGQTDGVVTTQSALSLGYLMRNARNYQVLQLSGHNAEHGRLTFNHIVERNLITFLWR